MLNYEPAWRMAPSARIRPAIAPRSRLLLAARQEWLERPLDRARAGTDCGLAAVGPGLRARELGAAPHEVTAVLRLVLSSSAFPAALKIDFLAVDRAGA